MGKQDSPNEGKKSQPAGENKAPKGEGGHGGSNHGHGGGSSHGPSASSGGGGGGKNVGAKVGCLALTCKEKDVRLGFCEEHFRQFKFGLITKTGQKVLDFEKKFEHYQKWLSAQRVA
ncbi:MAG: hypothetical protein AB1540_02330 [Bdellovibrionota bacterium]